MSVYRVACALFVGILLSFSTPAFSAGTKFLSMSVASRHLNSDYDYNENNFGIGFGYSFDLGDGWRTAWELGFYKNSYGEQTKYGLLDLDYRVQTFENKDALYLGGFVGLADYGKRAKGIMGDKMDPIGTYILMGGAQATYATAQGTDFILGVVPGAANAETVLTFRIRQRF